MRLFFFLIHFNFQLYSLSYRFIFLGKFTDVHGHGRLLDPPNRSSIWRLPEFDHLNPPKNYNDNELFCGGAAVRPKINTEVQHEQNGGLCGVCGDNYKDPKPRPNEIGGTFYKGIIVRNYTKGQVIDVDVELTTSHKGYFEFRICQWDVEKEEIQSCFDKNLLQLEDGSGTQFPVKTFERGHYKTQLKLPSNLKSHHAVFQWIYNTGNSWGNCTNGTSGLGCGNQETFRGCSDISIT